ncbi:Phage protein [hydrothermal vent metagenome]|uniref:Phage protein n=1 Tax=hydrothermal vent metagenome TaxID=652676 RepID=A0A3B0W301_9ZZZZ
MSSKNNALPETVTYVQVSDLLLDPQNPRFPDALKGKGQEEILQRMIDRENITDLINSIGAQGYFHGEPLLVVEQNQKYIVVEGNRRTAALILLQEPSRASRKKKLIQRLVEDAEHIPETVPVLIYPGRNAILKYLGYRHVTGIKKWGPLEKARYLRILLESGNFDNVGENEKYRELARAIGSKSNYVKMLLAGLRLFDEIESQDFYDIDALDEQTLSFSLITTAIGYLSIAQFVGLEDSQDIIQAGLEADRLEVLIKWMFEEDSGGQTRVAESRDLQKLNAVLQNENALKQFMEGVPLEKAVYYTSEPIKDFRKLISEAKEKLQFAWDTLAPVSNKEFTRQDVEQLENIDAILSNIMKFVDIDS